MKKQTLKQRAYQLGYDFVAPSEARRILGICPGRDIVKNRKFNLAHSKGMLEKLAEQQTQQQAL